MSTGSEKETKEKKNINDSTLLEVAKDFSNRMGEGDFCTFPRVDFSDALRDKSGQPSTRLKSVLAQRMDGHLLSLGLRSFPPLSCAAPDGNVRIFKTSAKVHRILEALLYPGEETDEALKKLMGEFEK